MGSDKRQDEQCSGCHGNTQAASLTKQVGDLGWEKGQESPLGGDDLQSEIQV